MDAIKPLLHEVIFGDTVVLWTLVLLAVAPIVDWIFGVLRAFRDKSFEVDALDVFVRTQYAGRVVPLLLLLVFGRILDVTFPADLQIPGVDLGVFVAAGLAPAAIFLGVTLKSIIDNATIGVNKAGVVPQE